MKVLIDTHIAIWAISEDPKLSKMAKDILVDESNEIYYSTASIWEIINRIMIAQTKVEQMKFLTHDSLIPYYHEPFIISV